MNSHATSLTTSCRSFSNLVHFPELNRIQTSIFVIFDKLNLIGLLRTSHVMPISDISFIFINSSFYLCVFFPAIMMESFDDATGVFFFIFYARLWVSVNLFVWHHHHCLLSLIKGSFIPFYECLQFFFASLFLPSCAHDPEIQVGGN